MFKTKILILWEKGSNKLLFLKIFKKIEKNREGYHFKRSLKLIERKHKNLTLLNHINKKKTLKRFKVQVNVKANKICIFNQSIIF